MMHDDCYRGMIVGDDVKLRVNRTADFCWMLYTDDYTFCENYVVYMYAASGLVCYSEV